MLAEQRVCGVEISDLSCLVSGHNPNLTSEDMADIQKQGIAVDDNNNPDPENISIPVNTPLTQLEADNSCRPEGIIFLR